MGRVALHHRSNTNRVTLSRLVYAVPLIAVACHGAAPSPGLAVVGRVREAVVSPPVDLGDHALGRDAVGTGGAVVAFGGGVYLVVWEHGNGEYRAARLSAAGALLDTSQIHVAPASGVTSGLVAGFDGANFRVVWSFPGGQYLVKAATTRVSPAGAVLDTPVTLAPTLAQLGFTGACSTNGCVLVSPVVPTNGDPSSLEIERIDSSGHARDSAPIAVPGSSGETGTAVVGTSTGYRLVWMDSAIKLQSMELDPTGALAGSARAANGPASTSRPLSFGLAASGSGLLVIEYAPSYVDTACYGYRLGLDGAALDTAATTFPSGTSCGLVASDGTGFLVADLLSGRLPAVPIDSSGAPGSLVRATIPVAPVETSLAMASDGTHYLMLGTGQSGVQAYLLDAQGNLMGSPIEVALVPVPVSHPDVATNGASMLAVWTDNRVGGSNGVYGTRVGLDGTVLTKGIPIAPSAGVNAAAGAPGVAAAGSKYLVAWAAGSAGIGAAQVAGDGTVSKPVQVSTSGTDFTPSVASDGTGYMLTWTDSRGFVSDVYTARVDGGGNVLDAGGVKLATGSTSLNDGVLPRVAWSGSSYAIAWRRRIPMTTGYQYDAQIAFVSTAGATVLPAQTVSMGQNDVDQVDIACGGGTCLVAWTSGAGVWIRRYDSSGLSPAMPSAVPGASDSPRVTWDGAVFQLVTHDSGAFVARTVAPDGTIGSARTELFSQGDAGASISFSLTSNAAGINYVAESTEGDTTTYGVRFTDDSAIAAAGGAGGSSSSGASGGNGGDATNATGAGGSASGGDGSGRGGTSGSAVTSGTSGTGGSPALAAAGGEGTTTSGEANDSGATAAGPGKSGSSDSAGCGCRQAASAPDAHPLVACGLVALAVARLRRPGRRRRSK